MPITSTAMRRTILVAPFAGVALLFCTVSAFSADVARGKQLARRVCYICHVIAEGQSQADPAAPSFQSIAASKEFRDNGGALLLQHHKGMPEFALDRGQIGDLTAYIRSLGK